jgi:uncharacterized protein (TIGR01440 family)
MAGITYEIDDKNVVEQIRNDAMNAAKELVEKAHLTAGNIVVIGCSTSSTLGNDIGSHSVPEVGKAIFEGLQSVFKPLGIYIAAQCCEHLNRCVIVEKAALLPGTEICNVVPQMHAGGSFAMTVYQNAEKPVAVEEIKADAGLDIGDTLIGMHLKHVAVPVRIEQKTVGEAHVVAARTRPKFIGGSRAVYDDKLSGGDIPR